jgi:hypothetical protein
MCAALPLFVGSAKVQQKKTTWENANVAELAIRAAGRTGGRDCGDDGEPRTGG